MQTYSANFFLTAFFTRKARRGVLVVGGGVSPAYGTAAVTAVVVDGADPTSSGSVQASNHHHIHKGWSHQPMAK
jgi:hypothetical protein